MRKPASDSVAGKIASEEARNREYFVPDGVIPLTPNEKLAWNDYLDAKDGWKASELRQLHKLVKLESEYDELFEDPESLKSDRYKLQGLIQAQVRLLGLNVPHNVAARQASEGKLAGRGRGRRKQPGAGLLQ